MKRTQKYIMHSLDLSKVVSSEMIEQLVANHTDVTKERANDSVSTAEVRPEPVTPITNTSVFEKIKKSPTFILFIQKGRKVVGDILQGISKLSSKAVTTIRSKTTTTNTTVFNFPAIYSFFVRYAKEFITKAKGERRLQHSIIVNIILVAIFLLSVKVILILNYTPNYEISFTKENFKNKKSHLFVDELLDSFKFGPTQNSNGKDVPEIITSPITFVWKPSEYPLFKPVTVSAEIQDEGDWDISVVCPNCSTSEKYKWQPFYRNKLKEYSLIKEFPEQGVYVYAKNLPANTVDKSNVTEWVKTNIPTGSNVEILDNSFNPAGLVNSQIDFKPGISSTITKTMRGSHTFYVYLKDTMELEVQKQDLNWYDGADDVTVKLFDLNNEEVFSDKLLDDEAATGRGFNVIGTYKKQLKTEGIYRLEIGGNNDWTIKSLKINTNKIVLAGTSLIVDPATLYTEVKSTAQIKLFIWHDTALQTVKFQDAKNKILEVKIGKQQLNYDQLVTIVPGEYNITLSGDQNISGSVFAFTKEQYFSPYMVNLQESTISDYYVTNVKQAKSMNGVTASIMPPVSRYKQLENLHEISFEMRNNQLTSDYIKNKKLADQGYSLVEHFDDIAIWALNKDALSKSTATTFSKYFQESVPVGSSVFLETKAYINANDFAYENPPSGFIKTNTLQTTINMATRGTHTFIVYAGGDLTVEFTKIDLNQYEGADNVSATLFDKNQKELCTLSIKDDNNVSSNGKRGSVTGQLTCRNLKPGVYTIDVKGIVLRGTTADTDNDFIISKIRTNTNKIMVSEKILNITPVVLYTNNSSNRKLTYYYWHEGYDQTVSMVGNEKSVVKLGISVIGKNVDAKLTKGPWTISLPKGDVRVSGSNFAFEKDHWFSMSKIDFLQNSDLKPDFVFIENSRKFSIMIHKIQIETK